MHPVVSCTGVSKTFVRAVIPAVSLQDRFMHGRHGRRIIRLEALKNVSLAVRPGEWLGIYGPNGCGKTTLLKILAGLMVPDSGSVERHGRVSGFFELGVGFHDERSAVENIRMFSILYGIPRKDFSLLAERIIAFAGVEQYKDLPIKCYSTGMKLRLAFAAASHVDADTYLFDEILAVGDDQFQAQGKARFLSLRAAGKTAVLISPTRGELEQYCHRILTMEKGTLVDERFIEQTDVIAAGPV